MQLEINALKAVAVDETNISDPPLRAAISQLHDRLLQDAASLDAEARLALIGERPLPGSAAGGGRVGIEVHDLIPRSGEAPCGGKTDPGGRSGDDHEARWHARYPKTYSMSVGTEWNRSVRPDAELAAGSHRGAQPAEFPVAALPHDTVDGTASCPSAGRPR
jgi:hypothetical protein